MIEYLRGEIAELTPATAIIECAGVGYEASITLNTYSAIQGKKEAKLYIYEVIREDTHQLFGFFNKQERELFLLLISVSGIGGNTARTILSAFTIGELCDTISSGDEKILKSVKGIGLKTAQRIIVELKDKIVSIAAGIPTAAAPATPNINKETVNEAVSALVMLGFPAAAANKVVQGIAKEQPESTVEQLIKLALKQL
ncbi:MAG: Holliday junction branch migration protein RuvA [Bacteroidaceae bacterium]|jgi:Holliday junction DNA helicase RuvA|nr:Holliday junction branch migration protein RuvA [Bacteroidaceae bacterium]MBQ4038348.1 Holliday junction branch migration protein RuvA [Bacteroidaceae bacterium]